MTWVSLQTFKTITLDQPWASLIADNRKPVETRPRPWNYDGYIAIHAGKKVDREACIRFGYDPDTIVTGAVVCVAEKVGCVRFPDLHVTPDEYGDYTAGRYGYPLRKIVVFDPIPARGKQGIWNWIPPRAIPIP